ncbi:Phosphoribosyl-dephospho-CoA transferase [Paraburkholderia domus]|jgi:malonate decarboxylase holo-[acyl-carrier-protein] synthase|uniref:Phosphoribosyl-dephospho-CoA transferase n=1 Tax=Paraburkholderia domus TaxID=2793075 RepID=A0A9N8NCB1_9BURK|nr:malonate decarboxylase holo-ACP synthase [Paraburkholderia domus]MBK5053430.1 malonate decarboxylase holo-ACP synthase [Burkholderia sp. R-70006]MBK5065288.1 malonate decarboxylase holo-ACP synthase [Burkholderia sp. R-70199]MBK5090408.1 malonate decarboxylase holo-ACP synthase [Burkholderia sp. R-69927]MBK5125211.1 malonate decarboxylase holo-ACP synthase [Burkholderia sp. R-69980]MBK5169328.1 malonate decarboxylase holo-ACP synthase [Burkholderia sp. R-70211]MBK5184593.1 malonate decarbo
MQVCAAPPFAADHALSCDARWQPHDLLRLRRLPQFDGEPAWVRESFECTPWAVVRRALAADSFVAIGLRGVERSRRYGTWVHVDDIETAVPPETLARRDPLAERNALPAFAALASLQCDTAGALAGFVWGPTGSTGFELATQAPTVTLTSDLDLLIRAPERLSRNTAMQLFNHLQAIARHVGIRVDAQLETPAGGVALAEWAADKARVMARHARGPQLIADPWAPAHGDI